MDFSSTCTRDVTVGLENGLHLVPSSQIVKLAQRFACGVTLRKGDRIVDGKSVLDLITLAAECGESLTIETSGADAAEALAALVALFERNFEADSAA